MNQYKPGKTTASQGVVLAVVCVALATVVSAMASLNVALPDVARSTHATPDPTRLDHRRLLAGLRRAAAAGRGARRPLRTASRPAGRSSGLRCRIRSGDDGRPERPN